MDKTLRPFCFCVFSDIFITCGDYIAKYLSGILELISKALEAAAVPIKEDVRTFILKKNFLQNFLLSLLM